MGRMLGKDAEEKKCMSRLRREAGTRKEIGGGRLAGVSMNPKERGQKGTGWRAAVEAKGPRRLEAEGWYMRRAVRAQEGEAGSRPASQPCPPETALVPRGGAADNAKGLHNPKAGIQRLPT